MSLPTNLKDDILDDAVNNHRRYAIKRTSNDQTVEADVYFEDITEYAVEGDEVNAAMLNASNTLVNGLTLSVTSIQVVDSLPAVGSGVEGRLYFSKS